LNIALVFGPEAFSKRHAAASHLHKRITTMTEHNQYDENQEGSAHHQAPANDLSTFCEVAVASGNTGSVGETNLTWLALDLIEEQEGFNLRDYERPDTVKHIERLALAWERSEQFQPIEVQVVDGHCYVRDGHCRLRAARLAASRGAPIKRLPVIELKGNDQLACVRILTSNEQLKLSIIQRAHGYQRLRDFNWPDEQIASHIGMTDTHVRETLRLLLLPESIQVLLEKGVIKPFLALDLWRKYGEASAQIILDAYEARKREQAELLARAAIAGDVPLATPVQAVDQAQPAPIPEPEIRLTSRHISAPTKRIGKKLITNMTSTMTGISKLMRESAIIDANNGTISVQIPIEEYERFMSISSEVSKHRQDEPAGKPDSDNDQQVLGLAS
jgi:ParB family chromosome partitioning protein